MNKAFSVIEIILASAIFLVICSAAIISLISGQSLNQTSAEQTVATQFASEGLEAAISIRNQSYTNLVNSTGTGISTSGGVHTFSGTNNTFDKYTRVITVSDVQRDNGLVSGNIVSSGGTVDNNTKKITSTVTWNVAGLRNNTVTLSTYLTGFRQTIIGNWTNPTLQSSINLSGNTNVAKIFVSGNYAYLVRGGASPNFQIVDISNPASPTLSGSTTISSDPLNIFVSGNYAYISSSANGAELEIVNVSNPASPSLVGSYNATGNTNATDVYVVGNTAFLTRLSSGTELMSINITNPASPSLISSVSLSSSDANQVLIQGNYAYIASGDNAGELKVVNITNPASMSLITSLNLSGNGDGLTITGNGNYLALGRTGELNVVDVTTPTSPVLAGTIAHSGTPLDSSWGQSGRYIFTATNDASGELKIFDLVSPTSPVLLGTYNGSGDINGVYYVSSIDRAACVGSSNTEEFIIVQP